MIRSFYDCLGMLGSPFAAMGLAGLAGHFGGLPTAASLAALGFPGGGHMGMSSQAAAALAAVAHHQAAVRGGGAGGGLGCVLLVSNLCETETEPDHLFILFGVYGDVLVRKFHFLVPLVIGTGPWHQERIRSIPHTFQFSCVCHCGSLCGLGSARLASFCRIRDFSPQMDSDPVFCLGLFGFI